MRFGNLTFLGLFASLLLLPVCNDLFHFWSFPRHRENRAVASPVKIDISNLDAVPKNTDKYVADNFSFRTPLLSAYRNLRMNVYQSSPYPEKMIKGTKDRYFMVGDELSDYCGERKLRASDLRHFKREWKKRKATFDSLGIAVYIIPAPTSIEVYSEELPEGFGPSKDTRFQKLGRFCEKHFPGMFIDVTDDLKAAKAFGKIYFDLDLHWTDRAGYVVSNKLLNHLKNTRYPELDLSCMNDVRWKTETRNTGYFADILNGTKSEDFPVAYFPEKQAVKMQNLPLEFQSEGVSDWDKQNHFVNKSAKNKQKVLVIRDSFGPANYAFLSEAFSETVFIHDGWKYLLNRPVLEAYKPDIVVYILYGANLKRIMRPGK